MGTASQPLSAPRTLAAIAAASGLVAAWLGFRQFRWFHHHAGGAPLGTEMLVVAMLAAVLATTAGTATLLRLLRGGWLANWLIAVLLAPALVVFVAATDGWALAIPLAAGAVALLVPRGEDRVAWRLAAIGLMLLPATVLGAMGLHFVTDLRCARDAGRITTQSLQDAGTIDPRLGRLVSLDGARRSHPDAYWDIGGINRELFVLFDGTFEHRKAHVLVRVHATTSGPPRVAGTRVLEAGQSLLHYADIRSGAWDPADLVVDVSFAHPGYR